MKHLAYPAYKPSGVAWLGEIPEHWDPVRLRYRAKINPIRSEINGLPGTLDVSFVPMESVHEYGGLSLDQSRPLAEVSTGYTYFLDGDVLAAKITPCFENGKGAIAHDLMNGIGFGTTELHVLRPHPSMDRHFLFYVTISHAFRHLGAAEMYGAGGQKRVPEIFIRDFRQSIPPLKEQRTVASFLDRETARIDTLIEKKQRQIELLQEKRSALISHAVIKGLNPNVEMRDSEVAWIGEVPHHWQVKRLKYLIREGLSNGLFKKKEFFGSGTKLVNVFDVYREDFIVDHDSLDRVEADEVEQRKYAVQSGDIFFVRSSLKLEGVGRSVCALNVKEPTVFECHIVRARPDSRMINPSFLVHFLNSIPAINRLISLSNLVTMATIDQDKFKSLEVPLPPREEQDKIMAVLDREGEKTKLLERRIIDSIKTLSEYRRALISAAVTGKMDVRKEVS